MNVEKIYALRKEFDVVCEMCDVLEQDGLWPLTGQISMRDCLRLELANFCIYLTASDDVVRNAESIFFKVALGFDMTADEINAEIGQSNIKATDYKAQVPAVISEIKGVQDASGNARQAACTIADLFYKMGGCVIACDGETSDDEKTDLGSYMDVINGFLGR